MYRLAIVAAALMAPAVYADPGKAIVVNGCNYDVHLCNVPAANGGYEEIDKILSPNDTYSQTWTELTNKMGWSIKLSKSADLSNILQYEYTYLSDGKIWYDLSAVNGNPWDGNWEVTAAGSDGCSPRQAAYRYSTDDAYGMQDCAEDADITVLLCSGEDQNDGRASSASVSMSASATAEPSSASSSADAPSSYSAEPTSSAAPSSSSVEASSSEAAPSSYSAESSSSTSNPWAGHRHSANNYIAQSSSSPSLTTFATATITPAPGITVTEIATAVVTEVVTYTHYADKREEHVHQHARRHPHGRQ